MSVSLTLAAFILMLMIIIIIFLFSTLSQIFSFVNVGDLGRCARVCRNWKVIIQANTLWSKVKEIRQSCGFALLSFVIGLKEEKISRYIFIQWEARVITNRNLRTCFPALSARIWLVHLGGDTITTRWATDRWLYTQDLAIYFIWVTCGNKKCKKNILAPPCDLILV